MSRFRARNIRSCLKRKMTFNSVRLQRVFEYLVAREDVLLRELGSQSLHPEEWPLVQAQLEIIRAMLIWMTTNVSETNDKAEVV